MDLNSRNFVIGRYVSEFIPSGRSTQELLSVNNLSENVNTDHVVGLTNQKFLPC